ncbi:MAG: FtsL-like putative cell division protein [Flavobacteriales bacterium]|jgi:hypothetical protein|nr:FtsL-like putative cell division protein [Flavobacteriales bacterium]
MSKSNDMGTTSAGNAGGGLPRAMVSVINGSFLARENVLRNMPFILFCAAMMIVYIAYGHTSERIVRDLDKATGALKEKRAEYISVRAELEKQEQQSQVAARISALGLKESRELPARITVTPDRPPAPRP